MNKVYIIYLQQRMADDSNDEVRNEIYMNEREFTSLLYDYERSFLKNGTPNTLLLYAKAYFIKQKYEQCIKLLEKIEKTVSTKVLYERQALLFKATYLLDPLNIANLEKIVLDYEINKNRCPGKRLTEFHHNSIKQLMEVVEKGIQVAKNFGEINKLQLKDRMQVESKKNKLEGMPSYLISVTWNKKFNNFLKNGPFPGPISNFQLINHVFELQPHHDPGKQYMDKLMFPLTEQEKYYTLSKRHWKIIHQLFSGYQIKRYFTTNPKNRQISGGDNLIKTLIQHNNQRYAFQWQLGTFWDKSILPALTAKFGLGQLKQQTRNKDFLVIQPGRAEQPYYGLKYVSVDTSCIKAQTPKQQMRKRKILSSFDVQKYNPEVRQLKNTVGLANLGNTCYMNSGLQFLSNLKEFSDYFLMNKHLSRINISETNKDGSFGFVTSAYGDIVKRLWFSHRDTRYIDPTIFKKTFGERYSNFQGNQQEDAQQFLMFFLNCLHQDLNQNAQMNLSHRESMGGKGYDTVRNIAVSHYNRNNKSIVSELFHGFRYEEIKCQCGFATYRFEPELMLHIQAPPEAPKITVYFVEAKNLTQAKRFQVYISKIQKVEEVVNLIKQYFEAHEEHIFIPFLYFEDEKDWQIIDNDKDIKYIMRATSRERNGYFFISQVKKPQPDEVVAMISYYWQNYQSRMENDGFPRFLSMKKSYAQSEYYNDLQNTIFETIPKNKIVFDRKQYIGEIKAKTFKSKAFQINYRVYMKKSTKNYMNSEIGKILGENVMDEGSNLEACLSRMSTEQIIDQWKCQKCTKMCSAHKTDKIYSISKYLIIQIKRFTQNGKITTKIEYPINNLDMKPYVEQQKQTMRKEIMYNLQGVILHRGSLNSGHYTCICKNLDKTGWMYFDDDSVREIDEKDVVDSNAYILIYERAGDGDSHISIR